MKKLIFAILLIVLPITATATASFFKIEVRLLDDTTRQVRINLRIEGSVTSISTIDNDGLVDQVIVRGHCRNTYIHYRSDEFVCVTVKRTFYVKLLREDVI
jgi:hypothetical protein